MTSPGWLLLTEVPARARWSPPPRQNGSARRDRPPRPYLPDVSRRERPVCCGAPEGAQRWPSPPLLPSHGGRRLAPLGTRALLTPPSTPPLPPPQTPTVRACRLCRACHSGTRQPPCWRVALAGRPRRVAYLPAAGERRRRCLGCRCRPAGSGSQNRGRRMAAHAGTGGGDAAPSRPPVAPPRMATRAAPAAAGARRHGAAPDAAQRGHGQGGDVQPPPPPPRLPPPTAATAAG